MPGQLICRYFDPLELRPKPGFSALCGLYEMSLLPKNHNKNYMDSTSVKNHGVVASLERFWAAILHSFGFPVVPSWLCSSLLART